MSFGDRQAEQLVDAVRQVAREEVLPRFRSLSSGEVSTKSREDDLVTIADVRSEERLTEMVGTIMPGAAVVGEEAVSEDPAILKRIDDADLSVILDPVDGTWNFAKGLGVFGMIVAVAAKGETIWGMLYDPLGDDWVVAERGAGTRHVFGSGGERRLALSREKNRADTINGYVASNLFQGEDRRRVMERISGFRRVDNYRCSAQEYRLMARGEGDFMLTPMINPWDHAAGCLAIEEAGGVARFLDGRSYNPTRREGRLLVAASQTVWAETSRELADLW